jgi:hypothetical protein
MDEYEALELYEETESRVNKFRQNIDRKIILTENEIVAKYNFAKSVIDRLAEPEEFGFTERYFGGNVYKMAIIKDSPYVILVDRRYQTLGVHIPNKNLNKLSIDDLKELCYKFSIPIVSKDTKKILVDKLTSV